MNTEARPADRSPSRPEGVEDRGQSAPAGTEADDLAEALFRPVGPPPRLDDLDLEQDIAASNPAERSRSDRPGTHRSSTPAELQESADSPPHRYAGVSADELDQLFAVPESASGTDSMESETEGSFAGLTVAAGSAGAVAAGDDPEDIPITRPERRIRPGIALSGDDLEDIPTTRPERRIRPGTAPSADLPTTTDRVSSSAGLTPPSSRVSSARQPPEPERVNASAPGFDTMSNEAMAALLDAAETAQQMTAEADRIAAQMNDQRAGLEIAAAKATRLNHITLIVLSGVLFVAILIFLFMSTSLSSRVAVFDETLVAVGERVVFMNASLRELQHLNNGLLEMREEQARFRASQLQLEQRLDLVLSQASGLPDVLPQEVSRMIQRDLENSMVEVRQQMQGFEEAIGRQQTAIDQYTQSLTTVQGRIERLDGRTASIGRLERDLEALVVLTRERVVEALSTARTAATPPEPELPPLPPVQFPPAPR